MLKGKIIMLPTSHMFETAGNNDEIVFENFLSMFRKKVPTQKKAKIETLMDDSKVKEFLEISEKLAMNKKLQFSEKQRLMALLRDSNVKKYLGETDTIFRDNIAGTTSTASGMLGGITGLFTAAGLGATAATAAASGVLVAAAFGVLGYKAGKILGSMYTARKASDNVKARVAGVPTAQIQMT